MKCLLINKGVQFPLYLLFLVLRVRIFFELLINLKIFLKKLKTKNNALLFQFRKNILNIFVKILIFSFIIVNTFEVSHKKFLKFLKKKYFSFKVFF